MRATFAAVAVAACLGALLGSGCASRRDRVEPAGELPDYATIAERYNERTASVDKIWARSVAQVWYPDREGQEQRDQVEGHFQFVRPDRVLLTFKKLGETYAVLGSNSERYWWIELGEQRIAHVGQHDGAGHRGGDDLGVPVHPLDLVEVMGVMPLPGATGGGEPGESGARVERARGGGILLTIPRRGGRPGSAVRAIRYVLDGRTLEPARIDLLDETGAPLLESELGRYVPVALAGSVAGGRVASLVEASIEGGRRRMRIRLYDPENRGTKPQPRSFDLDAVLKNYRVSDIRSLDE